MTTDGYEHADRHSPPTDEETEGKHSKRGRLIDALNRTKTKIHNVMEEREAKKHSKDSQAPESTLGNDVDDFLAAGRTSTSSRPSLGSVTVPPSEDSSTVYGSLTGSPRPSTSDSKPQTSPRRGLPITVPRIDVLASSRFPNARTVHPDDRLPIPGNDAPSSTQAGSLLAPEYKSRSMSSSSIMSKERRQRIRGLSVGFADAPPVIIGEGGDEAQAPPMEISRAKSRARSASPQARKTYPDPAPHAGGRTTMPVRGTSESGPVGFVPRPLARVQTGALDAFRKEPRGPHDDELIPSTPFAEKKPSLPARPQNHFQPIGRLNTGTMDLTKEFEMTLGINSSNESSPITRREPPARATEIAAPMPQRAPPSYDLLEHGRRSTPNIDGAQPQNQTVQTRPADDPAGLSHRRQIPAHQPQDPVVRRSLAESRARNTPPAAPQQQEAYFPPPPQRQTTVVKKHIQQLEPIQPRSRSTQQGANTPPKAPLQLVTEVDRGYRSFAERQNNGTMPSLHSSASPTIRHITAREYEESPSNSLDSKEATPHTATSSRPVSMRFYESMKQGVPPEGLI